MARKIFTADHIWDGRFYELAVELGSRSDQRLIQALESLWQYPDLEGCYLNRNQEPQQQIRVQPAIQTDYCHLQGVARLPNGAKVACGSIVIREINDGPDWLDFYIPIGALTTAYPCGGFPFETQSALASAWQKDIDDWLAKIGFWIAQTTKFALGLIGHEVSGTHDASEIANQGVPNRRFIGYFWTTKGELNYFQRTE